jgi:hypothetical protein
MRGDKKGKQMKKWKSNQKQAYQKYTENKQGLHCARQLSQGVSS